MYSAGGAGNIGGRGGDLEVETVKAFISILTGVAMALILYHAATQVEAEHTVKPPPVEAPATTAREAIVTDVCDFGGCSVATTATTLPSTTEESTNLEVFSKSELLTTQESDEEPVTESHNDGYIGTFYITGYTAEEGFPEGSETASGYGVRPGYCALNADQRRSLGISYGDQIYVEGLGMYMVMDSGCDWGVVDIWVYSNAEAYAITGSYDVYLV